MEEANKQFETDRKDPKIFWEQMRKLLGGKGSGLLTHIWGRNREKLYDENEKLERFKEVWQNVFEIVLEENRECNLENERTVTEYTTEIVYRTVLYRLASLNKLDNRDPLTKTLK